MPTRRALFSLPYKREYAARVSHEGIFTYETVNVLNTDWGITYIPPAPLSASPDHYFSHYIQQLYRGASISFQYINSVKSDEN